MAYLGMSRDNLDESRDSDRMSRSHACVNKGGFMHSLSLVQNDIKTIESFLSLHPLNSLQRSVREKEKVFLFHPAHLFVSDDERKIEGFLWRPNEFDIQYEIDLLVPVTPSLEIIIGSGDLDEDINRVVADIPFLCHTAGVRKDAMGKPQNGGGKGRKGFYLEVGIAKAKALSNFEEALKDGIGSDDFNAFCIPRNFRMKYCKG